MNKREFLLLAHSLIEGKEVSPKRWLWSEKLDGVRAFWDGGISIGLRKDEVLYANHGHNGDHICTGLWSRYGNVIHKPDWFKLPPGVMLDGELFDGVGLQSTKSRVSKHVPVDNEWEPVNFFAFDTPSPQSVFSTGRLNNPNFSGLIHWDDVKRQFNLDPKPTVGTVDIESKILREAKDFHRVCPVRQHQIEQPLWQIHDRIVEKGGEGLVIRDKNFTWVPYRSKFLLKVVRRYEAQCVIRGFGAEGNGKFAGRPGTIHVEWEGVEFDLTWPSEDDVFVIGQTIKFQYKGLTADGVPREGTVVR